MRTLELFNDKADQLLSSEFFAQVRGGGAIVEFNRESGWEAIYVGPDDQSTSALVLRLRLFIQDRDGISFRRLAGLYSSLPVSAAVKQEFDTHRSRLNAFLDSESRLAISDDGPLTYGEILKIFVYGEYAHLDQQQTFAEIRTTPFFPLFQNCLVDAVVALARSISAVQQTNRRALVELQATKS